MFHLPIALVCPVLAAGAQAQIVTDRPDLTESTAAVARLQVETGLLLEVEGSADGGRAHAVSGPLALVRVPLAAGVEGRVGLPDYRVERAAGQSAGAFGDPSVGAKVELGAVGPRALAAIAEVSLPLGDGEPSGRASPLGLLVAGRELGPVSLGTQAEVLWDRGAGRVEVGGTFVVGTGLSERVGAFAEVAAGTAAGALSALAQTGLTLLLRDDLQFDAALGVGLTDPAPDAFGGLGVGVRL